MKDCFFRLAESLRVWFLDKGLVFAFDALTALLILAAGFFAIGFLSRTLKKALDKTSSKHELAVRFIVSVAVKAAWAVLIVVVLSKLGLNVGPIIAGLGVTGFILGFAFQESLGSLASGLMIAINQPFRVGDFVSVAGYEGTVARLDMMAVTLMTVDSLKVTIPNKSAWGSPILNYSDTKTRRFAFTLAFSYSVDAGEVRRLVLRTLADMKGVLQDPAPQTMVTSLDAGVMTVTVRLWAANADYWAVRNEAVQSVKEALDRAGVPIALPQIDVHTAMKA